MKAKAKPKAGMETLDDVLVQIKPRWREVLWALPENTWNIAKAALVVGYKKSYAVERLPGILRRDVRFCRAQELLRAQVRAKTWTVEGWKKQCIKHQSEARAAGDRVIVHAYDVDIAKHIGAYEADNSQRGAGSLAELACQLLEQRKALDSGPGRRLIESSVVVDGNDD